MNPVPPIPKLISAADRAEAVTAAMWRAACDRNSTPSDVLAATTGIFCVALSMLDNGQKRRAMAAILDAVEQHVFGVDAIHIPTEVSADIRR